MQAKPCIGLILMRSGWYERPEAAHALESIQADAQEIVNCLGRCFEVQGPWVIDSGEALAKQLPCLREADLDMFVLVFQAWAEDARLVSLLQAVGKRPLMVWAYLPFRRVPRPASFSDLLRSSGPVGTLGALGTLRNLGVSFQFTQGAPDDPRLIADLVMAGKAAQVRRDLRSARIGLLPSRNEQVQSNFVDEFRLMTDFGPVVHYLSVSEYSRVVNSLAQVRVDAYLAQVRERFQVDGVSDEVLLQAARAALGLAHLALDYRLDILAINGVSQELHHAFSMRPALYPDLLDPLPVLFQPEGDLGAATANLILNRLTGSPTFFMEIWFWDEARNRIIGGHAGVQNPALADPRQTCITPDFDYQLSNPLEGAQFQFIARPGRVTLFQLRSTPTGWQAVATSGMSLEVQPWVQSYPHAVVRIDIPIDTFLHRLAQSGSTQHWVMAYGSVLGELEAFCQMNNIPLELMTA